MSCVAFKLEPWISRSDRMEVDDVGEAGGDAPARSGASLVETRLELCTSGSSTMPRCAPDSARTVRKERARAREASLWIC